MPRKKPYSNETTGWKGEARQEDIDSAVSSNITADGERTYKEAHEEARRRKEEGESEDDIAKTLKRSLFSQQASADDSPAVADNKKIRNSTERILNSIFDQGVEDALAGREANYRRPAGY